MNPDGKESPDNAAAKGGRGWCFTLLLMVLGLSALSIISRIHFIQTRPFAGRMDGQEPESHILVTDQAFDQTPWKIHHFLPIFNYGAPYNKFISNHKGAASADEYGNYYYCSTPPLTFVFPYFAMKFAGASPDITALRSYNMFLQVAATLALAVLAFLCAKRKGMEPRLCLLASATVAVIYMAAPECLKSHSINLWAQQFYAVLLPVEVICLLFYPSAVLLFIFAFIGCLEDWTPYIANTGMAAIALYSWWKTRDTRALRLAGALLLGCFLAGMCMIAWFSTVMTVHDYFHNLAVRGASRSGSFSIILKLILYYPTTFGAYILVGLAVLFLRPWSRNQSPPKREGVILPGADPFLLTMLIWVIALFENIVMGDHAADYSYDRLKAVQLLALFVAWGALLCKRERAWIFGGSLAAGLFSIYFFWWTYQTPQGWAYLAHSQQERLGAIIEETASTNGPAFFNGDVKGAEVYYARRNLVELTWEQTNFVAYAQDWCRDHRFSEGTLYEISGHYPVPDDSELPRSLHIRRIYADGRVEDLGLVKIPEEPGDYHKPSWWGHPLHNWRHIKLTDVLKALLWQ